MIARYSLKFFSVMSCLSEECEANITLAESCTAPDCLDARLVVIGPLASASAPAEPSARGSVIYERIEARTPWHRWEDLRSSLRVRVPLSTCGVARSVARLPDGPNGSGGS